MRSGQPVSNVYPNVQWGSDSAIEASAVTGAARWPSSDAPSFTQCVDQLARQAYSSTERGQIAFEAGLGLCVELNGQDSSRYVMFLRLPQVAAQPAIQAQATIWREPSS